MGDDSPVIFAHLGIRFESGKLWRLFVDVGDEKGWFDDGMVGTSIFFALCGVNV